MRKKGISLLLAAILGISVLTGCGAVQTDIQENEQETAAAAASAGAETYEGTKIVLDDNQILVDGAEISTDTNSAVYVGADIIYYKEGQEETYGEGGEEDAHSAAEAAEHTVVTITQPGTYIVSGVLTAGQIAVDLGEDAKKKEEAVVNLVLDNVDLTCTVAPAIIVYKVYECSSDDVDSAVKEVDTANAGFNLILADNSDNTVSGSYVAKIYKEGTTAEDVAEGNAKKLHKYDAAIESLMSFNINAGTIGNGKLTVNAENEGIETKLHMTINGGNITVNANDDSLNAGEDSVSVITINDGTIICDSGFGSGDEGDGIDSNGWIVINGGFLIACANAKSMDSGLDSDLGIYINGGTVLGSGNMYDEVSEDSEQSFMVLSFGETIEENQLILLTDTEENPISAFSAVNSYTTAVYSSPQLTEGDYYLYKVSSVNGDLNGSIYTNITDYADAVQLQYGSNAAGGRGPGGFGGAMKGEKPEGDMPEGERPEGAGRGGEPPEGTRPEGDIPEGARPEGNIPDSETEISEGEITFSLSAGRFQFSGISEAE